MIAAVLCPGPSLAKTCPPDGGLSLFDLVVAVNRAILLPGVARFVHWHACGDWDALQAINCTPLVGVCTQRDTTRLTLAGPHALRYAGLFWHAWEDLPVSPGYSTIAALVLAHVKGAKQVMVFGDDKHGVHDWDGAGGRDRREARWEREIMLQARAAAKLGMSITYVKEKAAV